MIEAIAAATVLALLALGVLAGIDGAAGSAGREKARAVASALAEQDQERMHAMRAIDLPEYRWSRPVPVGGSTYTVTSEADWVSDANGSTVSCQSDGGKADYLRLRTVVTSATVGSRTAAVRLDSIVAPPIGSAGGNNGTLAVQVIDRDSSPVPNVSVSIGGDNTGRAYSDTTNAVGCAIFAFIPVDEYDISIAKTGYVDPDGVLTPATSSPVSVGDTAVKILQYDLKATLQAGFSTQYWDPVVTKGWKTVASRGWALTVANSGMKAKSGRRIFAASDGSPQSKLIATDLFPFKDGYGVHSGTCPEENPDQFDPAWGKLNAFKFLDRGVSETMDVRQPALPVRIQRGTRTLSGRTVPLWYGGANVQARLVDLAPDSLCTAAPDALNSIALDSANGLQSYPAGTSYSGTDAANYADGLRGLVTKKAPGTAGFAWSDGYFDPGVPWGTWQICADDDPTESSLSRRRNFATVTNALPDGAPTYTVINITGTGSQNGRCRDGNWPAA